MRIGGSLRRWAWFIAIWCASVAVLTVVAFAIRLAIMP